VNIKPIPLTSSETIGRVGGRVIAITSIRVLLNVLGNALRRGVILDVEKGNYIGNRLEINTYFQNTGTTTISAGVIQRIYDKDGNFVNEIYSGREYVKPKEIKTFKTLWPITGLSLGNYNVYTIVDYISNKAEKSSVITLTAPPSTALAAKQEKEMVSPLFIIIIIFIVSIIIYKRI